ncbi:MAG: hypothetical protein LR005_01710 [Candidatus Pacebacteria bacterium]|nr:hypothetical protein [Candidatus Paceibacterota bacterium]
MKPQFKEQKTTKDYITHVMLHGERIIPSDSFEIGENEYILLQILKSSDDNLYLRIMGINGLNFGNIYVIPRNDFEEKNLYEIESHLTHYQY